MNEAIEDNRIWFGADGTGVPRIKRFLADTDQGLTPSTFWLAKDVGANEHAKKELKALMSGEVVFDNPKPVGLIARMLELATSPNTDDVVLDFFAGSASTAHAVMAKNAADHGNRKFIVVQLPETILDAARGENAASEFCASLGKDPNISELSKERIRRASAKVGEQIAEREADLGFKVFRLASSNIHSWDADFDTLSDSLLSSVENVKPDRSESDVLYELLLKFGLDLAVPIEEREIAGKKVFIIGAGALVVSLADDITLDVVEGIAALKDELQPEVMRVVLKDAGFQDDVVKTNAVQILRQRGIEDVKSL